jgi:hypothetical protein
LRPESVAGRVVVSEEIHAAVLSPASQLVSQASGSTAAVRGRCTAGQCQCCRTGERECCYSFFETVARCHFFVSLHMCRTSTSLSVRRIVLRWFWEDESGDARHILTYCQDILARVGRVKQDIWENFLARASFSSGSCQHLDSMALYFLVCEGITTLPRGTAFPAWFLRRIVSDHVG